MSITYNAQGKITLEPTNGNILGITEIVLQRFERTVTRLEAAHPHLDGPAIRRMARDLLEQNIETVTAAVRDSCRKAMMTRPEDALRKDLVGRILFHRMEDMLTDDMHSEKGFARAFTEPVLMTVRDIIGDTHYDNLNEHSARPSLEYCVVHELGASKISWEDFYNQNLVGILLVRIKNLVKRWLAADPGHKRRFIDSVNQHMAHGGPHFDERNFQTLMRVWGV